MFFKIGVIINFPIFRRKHLCWSLILIKLQDWWPATLLKKRPQHRCFPVHITKCLRKTFFMEHLWWLILRMVEEFPKISKGSLTRNYLWFNLSQPVNCKIMATFCIKIWMIQFLKDWISSTSSSDLYEEISKSNKSHTNHIIQIVLCKTALIQLDKDLYRRIYKRERFVKTFCSNWRHEMVYFFLWKQWYLARLNLKKAIFKQENKTIYGTNDLLWHLKFMEYCVQELKKLYHCGMHRKNKLQ